MLTVYDLLKICAEFEKKAQYTALDTTLEKGPPEYRGYDYGRGQIPFQRYVHFPEYKQLHPEFPIPEEKEPEEEEEQIDPYDPSTTLPLPGMAPPTQPKELEDKYDQEYYASYFKLPEIEPYHIQPRQETPGPHGYEIEKSDVDKPIEEIRSELLQKYDELKKALAVLFEKYKEANQRASAAPEIDVENLSLVETVRSLADYCINKIRWAAGRMFGDELSTNSALFSFLSKDFNIFGVTNLNFRRHIQRFNSAEEQIKSIIDHYEKLKRLEKNVAKNVQQAVDEFLSNQENIDILLWTDQHNPEAKKQIVEEMKKSLHDNRWRRRSKWQRENEDFSLNDLRSIRTFKEIYEKLSSSLTTKLKTKIKEKNKDHIISIITKQTVPFLEKFLHNFDWMKNFEKNVELQKSLKTDETQPEESEKINEIFNKLKISLKETLGLDLGSVEQYIKIVSNKRSYIFERKPDEYDQNKDEYDQNKVIDLFRKRSIINANTLLNSLNLQNYQGKQHVNELVTKIFSVIEKLPSDFIGQNISNIVSDQTIEKIFKIYLLKLFVNNIPGVSYQIFGTKIPDISNIKDILLETGNINFKSVADIIKKNFPGMPDNLLVTFVKYIFREDKMSWIKTINDDKEIFDLILKMLAKSNKLDFNSLVKIFPNFGKIHSVLNQMARDLPSFTRPDGTVEELTPEMISEIALQSIKNLNSAHRVFIGNLAPETTRETLKEKFESLYAPGEVRDITMLPKQPMSKWKDKTERWAPITPEPGEPETPLRGFAIMTVSDKNAAEIAERLNGSVIDDTNIQVYISHEFMGLARELEKLLKITKIIHNEGSNLPLEVTIKLFQNVNSSMIGKIAGIKKLYKAIVNIVNLGGPQGVKKAYGPLITDLIKSKLIGKDIYKNMQFLLDFFNSNQAVNPSNPNFSEFFRITNEIETDLDAIKMADTYKAFLKDYEPKNPDLFKLDYKINNRLRFRTLKDKDPRHLRVGIETDCCQRIGGVGESAAIDSFINPLAGVLILEWLDEEGGWKLLTQSYFHYVPADNGYILDNVEGNDKNIKSALSDEKQWDGGKSYFITLPLIYAWYANKMKKKLKLNYFLAGKGYTELNPNQFTTDNRKDDNRDFSDKLTRAPYSDYDEENSTDLTKPIFKLRGLDPKSWGQTTTKEKEIENKIASSMSNVRRMILRSYLIAA